VREAGGEPQVLGLSGDLPVAAAAVLERAPQCEPFVFASPTYRATYTAELKHLLDRMPRGMPGEDAAPLRARATAIALTGATLHHFLAVDSLRNVLAGFFGAFVLPGGLYLPHDGFDAYGELRPEWRGRAAAQGRALVALAEAIRESPDLAALGPLV
jgi:FMN reductase